MKKLQILFVMVLAVVGSIGLWKLSSGPSPAKPRKRFTSTDESFLNTSRVPRERYEKDTNRIIKAIDSLIAIGLKVKTGPTVKTYVNGQYYEDSVVHEWAIDLPMRNYIYEKISIDTLFYNPNDPNTTAGLLVSEVRKRKENSSAEYLGNGFVCKKNKNTYLIRIVGPSTVADSSDKGCREKLRSLYFGRGLPSKGLYNLDDVRYFASKEFQNLIWN